MSATRERVASVLGVPLENLTSRPASPLDLQPLGEGFIRGVQGQEKNLVVVQPQKSHPHNKLPYVVISGTVFGPELMV